MRSLWFIFPLALMIGCSSLRYSTYATRTGIPRAEIEEVAEAAVRRYNMAILDVRKTPTGQLEVVLGKHRDSMDGLIAVYQKTSAGWEEVEVPDGGFRVWLTMGRSRPNKRPDGTSAKAPPSNPSQGAAVPHP